VKQEIYDVNQIKTELASLKHNHQPAICNESSKKEYMEVVKDTMNMYLAENTVKKEVKHGYE